MEREIYCYGIAEKYEGKYSYGFIAFKTEEGAYEWLNNADSGGYDRYLIDTPEEALKIVSLTEIDPEEFYQDYFLTEESITSEVVDAVCYEDNVDEDYIDTVEIEFEHYYNFDENYEEEDEEDED